MFMYKVNYKVRIIVDAPTEEVDAVTVISRWPPSRTCSELSKEKIMT